MRLTEQFKNRLQKLAGIDPGKKAIPKRGGTFPHVDTNIWFGCSVCGEDTAMPGETACQPLIPFEFDLPYDDPPNTGSEGPPNTSNWDWGTLANGEGILEDGSEVNFDVLIGSDGQPYDYVSHNNATMNPTPNGDTLSGYVLFNQWAIDSGMYGWTQENYCPGEETKLPPKDDPIIGCTNPNADNYNPEATEPCNEGLVNSCCENSCNGYGNPDAAIGDEDYGWGSASAWGPWGAGCSETWMDNYCNEYYMQYTSWQTFCNACPCIKPPPPPPPPPVDSIGCTCPDAWNYDPSATYYTDGNQTLFCMFFGCSDPEALNYDPTVPTQSTSDGYFNSPPFDDTVYCESTGENVPAWGLGASDAFLAANEAAWPELCEYPEIAECANYPAACCLQQVYGQDIFGTTVPWQEEEINVPSAAECEGMTIIWDYAGSTPWPHGDNTFYDGVEYTHNPNNSFKQGCCYPLL